MSTSTFSIATGADDGAITRFSTTYPSIASDSGSADTDAGYFYAGRERGGSATYYVHNGFLRFNTAAFPDTAEITSVVLRVSIVSTSNANSRNLTADWYDFGGTLDSADYSSTALTNALSGAPISGLVVGSNDLNLTDSAGFPRPRRQPF